jgi:hypothetical protein
MRKSDDINPSIGPTEEELLTALYYDHSRWLEDMKTVCKRAGIPLEQHLKKALGLAVESRRVRNCDYDTALKLRGPERTGQDILLFFVTKCPHAREALLEGELPPYPWRISQTNSQEQKLPEAEQKATLAKPEKESWLWKLYEKTLKAFFDSLLGKFGA